MTARPWPHSIAELLADLLGPELANNSDHQTLGLDRWSLDRFSVQRFADEAAVRSRYELLQHLGTHVPVPSAVGSAAEWLVTARPPGQPIGRPELHPEPGGLAILMGESLRLLHDLDSESLAHDLALPTGWSAAFARCRDLVEGGRVETTSLPTPYDRYQPAKLLALLESGRPEHEDLVLCHGSVRTEDLLADAGTFSGFDGLDYLIVADRHLDLALAHSGVHNTLGAEAAFAMYDGYGLDADLIRLDHYMLMGVILQSGFAAGQADTGQELTA